MPFTANRAFKSTPRLLVSAKDMHYTSEDGRLVLDGTAGLWCVNAGHCRPQIVAAIQQAANTLDFGPTFQLGHPLAFELATRVGAGGGRSVEAWVIETPLPGGGLYRFWITDAPPYILRLTSPQGAPRGLWSWDIP